MDRSRPSASVRRRRGEQWPRQLVSVDGQRRRPLPARRPATRGGHRTRASRRRRPSPCCSALGAVQRSRRLEAIAAGNRVVPGSVVADEASWVAMAMRSSALGTSRSHSVGGVAAAIACSYCSPISTIWGRHRFGIRRTAVCSVGASAGAHDDAGVAPVDRRVEHVEPGPSPAARRAACASRGRSRRIPGSSAGRWRRGHRRGRRVSVARCHASDRERDASSCQLTRRSP